jgi:hypothetical protein
MLCRSLTFAKRLAYCFISFSECDVVFIRNIANTYSFQQLGGVSTQSYWAACLAFIIIFTLPYALHSRSRGVSV